MEIFESNLNLLSPKEANHYCLNSDYPVTIMSTAYIYIMLVSCGLQHFCFLQGACHIVSLFIIKLNSLIATHLQLGHKINVALNYSGTLI